MENKTTILNLVASDLENFEKFWKSQLISDVDIAQNISTYLMSNAGKRVRPALVFLIARSLGGISNQHMLFATVVECFHNATLLHDDVIDDAHERRGEKSVNVRWSNSASILAGDYLYSHSLEILGQISDPFVWRVFTRATTLTVEGELLQLAQQKFSLENSIEQYRHTILNKTAYLFAVAGEASAYLASASTNQCLSAKRFCLNLGILFQLIDDYLDYEGHESGKAVGNDLREGKFTLPIIVANTKMSDSEKIKLKGIFGNSNLSESELFWVKEKISYYGGFQALLDEAEKYAQISISSLDSFPESVYKNALKSLPYELINRVK